MRPYSWDIFRIWSNQIRRLCNLFLAFSLLENVEHVHLILVSPKFQSINLMPKNTSRVLHILQSWTFLFSSFCMSKDNKLKWCKKCLCTYVELMAKLFCKSQSFHWQTNQQLLENVGILWKIYCVYGFMPILMYTCIHTCICVLDIKF